LQFDLETLPPQNRYKLMSSTIVPRPIAWAVTQDEAGRTNAAPFSFFNMFSSTPPVIALGISRRPNGAEKDTWINIRRSKEFVVNLVSEELTGAMSISAIDFAQEVSEIEEAGLKTMPSLKVKPPRIALSPVALECEMTQGIDLAEGNTLVIGKVLAMHIDDELILDKDRCHVDTRRLTLIGRMENPDGYVHTREHFKWPRINRQEWEGGRRE